MPLGLFVICALLTGCVTTRPRGMELADAALFGPLPTPADFDQQRARTSLADIPDHPSLATPADTKPSPELPRQALQKLKEARRLFGEGDYKQSIIEADKALRYNADIEEAHRLKALACRLTGDTEQARSHAEQALAIRPDDLACHYVLAQLADQAGEHDEALRRYRLTLQCKPEPATAAYLAIAHHQLGKLLIQDGYYAAGAEQLEMFFRASLAMIMNKEAAANPELKAVVHAGLQPAIFELARVYSVLGRFDAAVEPLNAAVQVWPDKSESWSQLICTLVRAKRVQEAGEACEQFVIESDASRDSLDLLVALHRYTGHPERAIQVIERARVGRPDHVELSLAYVDALLLADRRGEAADALERLLVDHPDLADAHWRLIGLKRADGDLSLIHI